MNREMPAADSEDKPEQSAGSPELINTRVDPALLRLPLHVILGQAEISVGELIRISKGQLIEFEIDRNAPLRLVLAGETIASGRLVRCGERYAVQILYADSQYRLNSSGAE